VAVLSFLNNGGNPRQQYFADGLVEETITALSRFKSLFVIACSSTFTYKGRDVDVRQVGVELGVRICKSGSRIGATALLIEAATATQNLGRALRR
jgi:adenylate cyclase